MKSLSADCVGCTIIIRHGSRSIEWPSAAISIVVNADCADFITASSLTGESGPRKSSGSTRCGVVSGDQISPAAGPSGSTMYSPAHSEGGIGSAGVTTDASAAATTASAERVRVIFMGFA